MVAQRVQADHLEADELGSPKGFRRLMSFFRRSSTVENQTASTDAAGAAAATAVARREIVGQRLPVINDSRREKDLIQVHPLPEGVELVRSDPAHFYCLDMEETKIEALVEWVRAARHVGPFGEERVPVIFVIGPGRSLSPTEMDIVNHELTPTGAFYFRRPDYNAPFDEAMKSLRDKLERQSGSPDTIDAWRWKQQAAETVGSHS